MNLASGNNNNDDKGSGRESDVTSCGERQTDSALETTTLANTARESIDIKDSERQSFFDDDDDDDDILEEEVGIDSNRSRTEIKLSQTEFTHGSAFESTSHPNTARESVEIYGTYPAGESKT